MNTKDVFKKSSSRRVFAGNIQHFANREHINFRSGKLVSNQDPDAFKSISQATNIDSYFSLSLLLVGNTLFSCKKEF